MKVRITTDRTKKELRRIHLLLFILLSFSLFLFLSFLPKEDPPARDKALTLPSETSEPPPLEVHKKTIRMGMTLTDILAPHGFSPSDIHALREGTKSVYDLARIKAGHEVRVSTSPQGQFLSLEYDIDEARYLHIQKDEDGYKAEVKKIPYKNSPRMIWGLIEDNLISAVKKEDEEVQLALDLADLFAWDIDFYADLRRGDSFKFIFEKKYREGKFVGYGPILTAEFINQGRTYRAFRYTYPDTRESDYFDLEGKSLKKEFLKSPIRYTRITSRFSHRRLHPIRKVFRPHLGVDYAAPVGTPVQATADGTVLFAGSRGASGRMVHIRHSNRYETMYLHLRTFARGIERGVRVKGGQEIGYVGSSGESTGPHLDYRLKKDGQFINPLTFNPDPVKPLRPEFAEDFRKKAGNSLLLFEAPLLIFRCFSSTLAP